MASGTDIDAQGPTVLHFSAWGGFIEPAEGRFVYHALNGARGGMTIFLDKGDYAAFETVLLQAGLLQAGLLQAGLLQAGLLQVVERS